MSALSMQSQIQRFWGETYGDKTHNLKRMLSNQLCVICDCTVDGQQQPIRTFGREGLLQQTCEIAKVLKYIFFTFQEYVPDSYSNKKGVETITLCYQQTLLETAENGQPIEALVDGQQVWKRKNQRFIHLQVTEKVTTNFIAISSAHKIQVPYTQQEAMPLQSRIQRYWACVYSNNQVAIKRMLSPVINVTFQYTIDGTSHPPQSCGRKGLLQEASQIARTLREILITSQTYLLSSYSNHEGQEQITLYYEQKLRLELKPGQMVESCATGQQTWTYKDSCFIALQILEEVHTKPIQSTLQVKKSVLLNQRPRILSKRQHLHHK